MDEVQHQFRIIISQLSTVTNVALYKVFLCNDDVHVDEAAPASHGKISVALTRVILCVDGMLVDEVQHQLLIICG